ncbi:MAG: response regulator transcription factor [Candidatus Peribacteraceae bacterium]|nr:response regulator transcription factor [Candidatus Peribacteraceae bacterium]MDD5742557.1 response regulator transcription factor [Candidatus Peribacteraceae bacterium]
MHILLIEDQEKLAENIRQFLQLEHYAVTVAHDGKEGFEKAMTQEVDLLILDVNLPGMDGYLICSMLRQQKKDMPILMLTARTKQQEIIHGLDLGADDYLGKPFDLDELLARVRALLRRKTPEKQPRLTAGSIVLDTNTHEVFRDEKKIGLSPKEYGLFEFLLRNKGIVQERPRIIEHVWGGRDDLMFSQTVDVHVAYLRRKLGKDVIETVPGKGYLIPAV